MSKFNTKTVRPTGISPIKTEAVASGTTFEGGAGYARDAQSELFLLAVSNMVGEATFYEKGEERDNRFLQLIQTVASVEENIKWLTGFAVWLRGSANMRSASLMLAAEVVHARLAKGFAGGNREIINGVLQRPDEPGEMLAYWTSNYGRAIPKPVKRGVADAASRMYNERAYLKYNGTSHAYLMQDVVALTRPVPSRNTQNDLFEYMALNRVGAEGRELIKGRLVEEGQQVRSVLHDPAQLALPESLTMLYANRKLRELSPEKIQGLAKSGKLADRLKEAGMTWENIPALVNGPWTKELWESIIPSMGYMALLRNLKNFDEAGVSDGVAKIVADKLSDPEQVAKSRQLPMRFLSAYNKAPSLRWSWALDQALDASLASIPSLSGRTLILVDTSGSMHDPFSRDGSLMRWDAATLFGLALARRAENADVVSFSGAGWGGHNGWKAFPEIKGESLLSSLKRWKSDGFFIGGGTDTARALQATFKQHDRVVILTDEQASYGRTEIGDLIPKTVPLHTYNLAGYRYGQAPSGGKNRYTSGGLTDLGFAQIQLLERGYTSDWPWEK